jgi:hypothetical protein
LKALLKELGFNWNGPSCSISELFRSLKVYINPAENQPKALNNIGSVQQASILGFKRKEGPKTIIEIIKDLFYSTGKTLFELFKQTGSRSMTFDSFKALIDPISDHTLTSADLESAFNFICRFKKEMSFQEFSEGFQTNIPLAGSLQSETLVIQKVRDWMFSR